MIKKLCGFILLVFFVFFSISCNNNNNLSSYKTKKIKINEIVFTAYVADNPEKLMKGLMGVKSLDYYEAMLFVFDEEKKWPFWMKNTLIPLDMIFISKDKKIADIIEAEPCTQQPCKIYEPEKEAMYVLEINKGLSKKYGFYKDMTVEFS